jgi:ribosomal protein L18E
LWQKLLEQGPTNDDLRYLIRWVEPLREKVEQKLYKKKAKRLFKKGSREEIMEEIRDLY